VIERQFAVARIAAINAQSREALHLFGLRRLLLEAFSLVVAVFSFFSGTAFIQFAFADHTGRPAKVMAIRVVTAVDAQAALQNFPRPVSPLFRHTASPFLVVANHSVS
jgi:hypothetical protein